jgi:serine-type D-Ala-D-Ala carboxypeptidase/endopeptidase (penicillin-binding protein 4)
MSFFLSIILQIGLIQTELKNYVSKFEKAEETKHMSIGISIRNLENGKEVYQHQSAHAFTPASTLKLLSTGLALEKWGPDYRFKTKVYHTGKINEGVIKGDLIISTDFDPSFGTKFDPESRIQKMIDLLKAKGINKIEGKIIVIQDERLSPNGHWLVQDLGNYYAALARRFNYQSNQVGLSFNTLGALDSIPTLNNIPDFLKTYSFNNKIKIAASHTGDQSYIFNYPGDKTYYMVGTLGQNNPSFIVKASISHPEDLFIFDFSQSLKTANIGLENKIFIEKTITDLFEIESIALSELIKECNFKSDNFIAEALSLKLCQDSISFKDYVRKSCGIYTEFLNIYDGSGLSPQNSLSPYFLSNFLFSMSQSPHFDAYYKSLPVVGKDGTVASLDPKNLSKGKVRCKSGTINSVKSYAGYISSNKGKKYSFSFVINGIFEDSEKIAKKTLENIIILSQKHLP